MKFRYLIANCTLLSIAMLMSLSATAGMSSGFKGGSGGTKPSSYSRPAASPSPSKPSSVEQTKSVPAPAAKSKFGSFGTSNNATTTNPPKTQSAMAADLAKSNSQAEALKTLDARKTAAVVGTAALVTTAAVATTSNSERQDGSKSISQQASNYERTSPSNYQTQPQTVVIHQDSGSGLAPAIAGYMVGQAMASNRHDRYESEERFDNRTAHEPEHKTNANISDSVSDSTSKADYRGEGPVTTSFVEGALNIFLVFAIALAAIYVGYKLLFSESLTSTPKTNTRPKYSLGDK